MQTIHCIDTTKSLQLAHCTLKTIKHKQTNKLERDKSEERASKTCGEYLCKTI